MKSIRIITLTFYLAFVLVFSLFGQETIEQTRWAQATFIPGFGTSNGPSDQYVNHISFNILSGYEYGLQGFELGILSNWDVSHIEGAQLSTLLNYTGGNVSGTQISAIANYAKGNLEGTQISAISNTTVGDTKGLQLTAITNINVGHLKGSQISAINNYSREYKGLQLSTINNTTKTANGLQLAVISNYAKELKGVQFGLINIADSVSSGLQIGLINIVKKNGKFQFGVEHGDVIPIRATLKTGINSFYTILSAGTQFEDQELWSIGTGFGSQFKLHKNLFANVEAHAHWLLDQNDMSNETMNLLNKLNVNIGYELFNHLSITAGPALNVYVAQKNSPESDTYGYDIAKNVIYEEHSGNYSIQMWVGYQVAIHF
ncbi:MAG: hypothetical protein OCD76_09905 [Reichenbachiella sp.]